MIVEKNASGKPLASSDWLENHHNAKKRKEGRLPKSWLNSNLKALLIWGAQLDCGLICLMSIYQVIVLLLA